MASTSQIFQTGKQILTSYAVKIPETVSGIERQIFIGNEIITKMSDEHKSLLWKLLNALLTSMRKIDASDIDLGGWAAKHQVWLRIQGVKKPIPDFGTYTVDEFNILIQSLLMEGQRKILYNEKNLDFSYSFQIDGSATARHRARGPDDGFRALS